MEFEQCAKQQGLQGYSKTLGCKEASLGQNERPTGRNNRPIRDKNSECNDKAGFGEAPRKRTAEDENGSGKQKESGRSAWSEYE